MEFVSGGDLMSYIVKHGTLGKSSLFLSHSRTKPSTGETDTRYFAYQICDALVVSVSFQLHEYI